MALRVVPGRLLRTWGAGEERVRPVELFFDLVYVFAITQLSHLLLAHPTVTGALEAIFLLFVVWWAWQYTTWFTNWFDPDAPAVRLVLIGVMLASLVLSVAIPEAFGARGLLFALAYVAIQVGRTLFAVLTLGADHPLGPGFRRILAWFVASGVFWVAGGLVEGAARPILWLIALAIDYGGPAARYWTPGLGQSRTEEWTIDGGHFAERCQLIIIVAIGESILLTGATFGAVAATPLAIVAFVVAFLGSAALWWLYFAHTAHAASHAIAHADDPGRFARAAYTYSHLPMIAGIIALAAADELVLAHPGDPSSPATVALLLGGGALYLIGQSLFAWTAFGRVSRSRIVAVLALAALVPLGLRAPALALSVAATVVAVLLAAWDALAARRDAAHPLPSPAPVGNTTD